jgi:hypothetical protein
MRTLVAVLAVAVGGLSGAVIYLATRSDSPNCSAARIDQLQRESARYHMVDGANIRTGAAVLAYRELVRCVRG